MIDVREVLSKRDSRLETIGRSETVMAAINRFGHGTSRCLMVTEGDALVGVVSIRDVVRHIDAHGADALAKEVSAVMTRDVTTVDPEARLEAVAQVFADSDFNHLPVVDDGVLVGVVTPADVLRTHLGHVQQEAGYLRDYISGVYY